MGLTTPRGSLSDCLRCDLYGLDKPRVEPACQADPQRLGVQLDFAKRLASRFINASDFSIIGKLADINRALAMIKISIGKDKDGINWSVELDITQLAIYLIALFTLTK